MKLEFYFDFSCPYAYLGSTQIEAIAARHKAELVWKPMLLGGVFRAVSTPMNLAKSQGADKNMHSARDMQRWADRWSVPLQMPAAHPMKTVRALRALLAIDQADWPALIHAFYRAYWVLGMPFDSAATVEWALAEAGIGEEQSQLAIAANENPTCKAELRARTDEAIGREIFGAPTVFVGGESMAKPMMFWGQDRLDMVEAVLRDWRPPLPATADHWEPPSPPVVKTDKLSIDFWYDFSSPFAYLGATQIKALAERCGATLRWRPLLLGALFRSIGTPNVPLLEMSAARRSYQGRELVYWASRWNQPFEFSKTFPLRTVTALRLALLAGDRIGEMTELLFRAAWADNQNIGDEAVLLPLLRDNYFDGSETLASEMLAECQAPATKALLRTNTEEAQQSGVFGVPTSIVTRRSSAGNKTELYWGQDRLALLEDWCRTPVFSTKGA